MSRLLATFLLFVIGGGCAAPDPPCSECIVLHDVTVIDGLGNDPEPRQVVVVRDGRINTITSVDEYGRLTDDQTVMAAGMFVMPGMIDMHAHITVLPMDDNGRLEPAMNYEASTASLETFLNFGITTLRNPAAPTEDGIALRDAIRNGEIAGPEIFTSGNPLNRTAAPFGPFVATPNEQSARDEVRRQAERGVDFIKVYSSLPPHVVGAVIEEAHTLGLEVVGHLQRTSWTDATRLGIDHITHGAPWSSEYLPESSRSGYSGTIRDRMTWLEQVDFDGFAIREMIDVMADSGVTVDPTLVAYRTKFLGDDQRYQKDPDSHHVPQLVQEIWQQGTFTADWTPSDFARGRRLWPRVLELTKALFDSGVRLTTGSDYPNPWIVPGAGLHEELQLLADAGIPIIDVIQIATSNGAAALGISERTGSVEMGKEADLIILREDPTTSLSNTRSIEWVINNGEIHSRHKD